MLVTPDFSFPLPQHKPILHNMLYTDGGHWERKSWYLKAGVIYTLVDRRKGQALGG